MTKVKVGKISEVYANVVLSDGKTYVVFPPFGVSSSEGMLDLISSYSLKGKNLMRAYDSTGKVLGISTQAIVTVQGIPYIDADKNILKWSGREYEEIN